MAVRQRSRDRPFPRWVELSIATYTSLSARGRVPLRRCERGRLRGRRLRDREADRPDARTRALDGARDDLQRVDARLEIGACGAAAGDPEGVAAGQHVGERRESAEALPVRVPEV